MPIHLQFVRIIELRKHLSNIQSSYKKKAPKWSPPSSLRPSHVMASKLLLLLPVFSLLLLPVAAEIKFLSHGNPFNDSTRNFFNFLGSSKIDNAALQLTPDTSNEDSFFINKSGRVILKTQYRIWDFINHTLPSNETLVSIDPGKKVLSFNSSFVFNIYPRDKKPVAEGLAFVIVPDSESIPDNSYGGFLGLTNTSLDGNPNNQFFAVEFDTFQQPYDPDGNHVGININSVRSIANRSLSELNITLAPLQKEGVQYRAWVEYDGSLRRVEVYLAEVTQSKPNEPVLSAAVDLGFYLKEKSYFGFSGSTGTQFQLNCVLSWNLTVEILPEKNHPNPVSLFLKIGLPILAVFLLVVSYFGFRAYKRRGRRDEKLARELSKLPGTPREFPYSVLKKATRNFDVRNELGRGGFGVVYRGIIPGENIVVAVKKFERDNMQVDFLAELTIINRLRHKNLVSLLGWCYKKGNLLLVYDFMPNGSLDQHLYSELSAAPRVWRRRVQILAGVASALHYLHIEYDPKVVHRDIKTNNILLDAEFNARLGDFGLARTIENERTSYAELEIQGVPGTLGYIAPECFHTGKATRESDVFGFGVVILEVVSGRKPRGDIEGYKSLPDWVWSLFRARKILSAVDMKLKDYDTEEARKLLLLGLACTHPNAADRPKTGDVYQVICGSASPPELPTARPAFVWPSERLDGCDISTDFTRSVSPGTSSSSHILHDHEEYSGTVEFISNPVR